MFPFQDNILKKSSLICLPEGQITSDPSKGSQNIKRPCRHFPPPLLVPSTVQQWPPVCLSAVQTLPLPSRAPANTAARRLLNNNIDFFGNTRLPAGVFWQVAAAHICSLSVSESGAEQIQREMCRAERDQKPDTAHVLPHFNSSCSTHITLTLVRL